MEYKDEVLSLLREIRDNTAKRKTPAKRAEPFHKPSLSDVAAYVREIKADIRPQSFIDFHDSKGWMIGKNKMKDWKAAVRTWAKKDAPPKAKAKTKPQCVFCKVEQAVMGHMDGIGYVCSSLECKQKSYEGA